MPPISKLSVKFTCALLAGLSIPFAAPTVFPEILPKVGYANAQAQSATFSDVSADYWATDYIEGLAQLNVISGFNDGTFKPNDPVTRAEFAAILHQAFFQSQTATAQAFVDVPADYWAADDISAARAAGFLAGYPDNSFEPDANIPKAQALVSLANGLGYTASSTAVLSAYEDAENIPPYARPSIAAAIEANLAVNYPYPQQLFAFGNASRADVAAYVYQALVEEGRAKPLAAKAERRWQTESVVTIPTAAEQMSLSGSGQQIATIPIGGNKLQIWNTQTGMLLKEISADAGRFNSVAISQDGTKVATVDQKSPTNTVELSVWSVETGNLIWQKSLGSAESQPPHSDRIVEPSVQVAFNSNDSQIVTQANLSREKALISFYNSDTGSTLRSLSLDVYKEGINTDIRLSNLTLSADGQFLATLVHVSSSLSTPEPSQDFVSVWQATNNGGYSNVYSALVSPFRSSSDMLFADMTFTNSGFFNLLTGNPLFGANQLNTLNLQIGMEARSMNIASDRTDAFTRLSPDGEHYFVRGDVAGSRLVNIQTGEIQNLEGEDQDTAAMFSHNGDYLAVASPRKIRMFSKSL